MAIPLIINGQVYEYPETGNEGWGPPATSWAQAVTVGMLQKSGGLFQLLADVDFGSTFGIRSTYFSSRSANIATTGQIRLARTDSIVFRNTDNTANLVLNVDASNNLLFNGNSFSQVVATVGDTSSIDLTLSGGELTADVSSSVLDSINEKLDKSGGTMTGPINMGLNKISNVDTPTLDSDAATKLYVDNAVQGIDAKQSVRVTTTSNGTFASAFQNGATVNGIVLATNDRILIKDQTDQTQNGIYTVNASGAPTRALDANTWSELVGAYTFVEEGTTLSDTGWLCSINSFGSIGVNNITFVQFSSAGVILAGSALTKVGNTLNVNVDDTTIEVNSNNLRIKGVTSAELGYLSGVTSAIQTQLNNKITNPMSAGGDIIIGGASGVPTRLANGVSGQVLTAQGGTNAPIWTAPSTPGTTDISGNYTILDSDVGFVLFVDTTASRLITLPTASSGFRIIIKDVSGLANTNNIVIVRAGSEQIEGIGANKILQTNWGSWQLVCDGTNWFLI